MNYATAEYNPYQAPVAGLQSESALAPDTEFLVSDEVVLCGETLSLPRVCIETGSREGLTKEERVLKAPLGLTVFLAGGFLLYVLTGLGYQLWTSWVANRFVGPFDPVAAVGTTTLE